MFTIGLTGGIGSGKSTVAELFAQRGAGVVDTDVIAHSLTGSGGAALAQIEAVFGISVLTSTGALDRDAMRRRVFADPHARKQLEGILHPMIRQMTWRTAETLAPRHPYLMIVVPLLVESGGWRAQLARILVVDCPRDVQITRVMSRNHLDREQVEAILSAQASRDQRLAVADDVIDNSGAANVLPPQVEQLHEKYCKLATLNQPLSD